MSLYAQYLKEREGIDIIEMEHGFITYTLYPKAAIHNFYVEPSYRKTGLAKRLEDSVLTLMREEGLSRVYGFVAPGTANADYNLKMMLANGYCLDSTANNIVILYKDIN